MEPEVAIHQIRSPSPAATWNLWRRYVLTWSEAQKKGISKWKDLFWCLPRLRITTRKTPCDEGSKTWSGEDPQVTHGPAQSFWDCQADHFHQYWARRRLKSPLLMPKSTFLISWEPAVISLSLSGKTFQKVPQSKTQICCVLATVYLAFALYYYMWNKYKYNKYIVFIKCERESASHSVMSDSFRPRGLTVAHQAPLSIGFFRQEYWSWLPFPFPGDFLDPGMEPGSPVLQANSLPSGPKWSIYIHIWEKIPESCQKQNLNLLCTCNCLHSIYIVFTRTI